MKKIILAAVLIISANAAFSQVMKGQWLIGGSANIASQKVGGETFTNISFNPNAGYFFMDKFAGGLRVNLASATGGFSSFTAQPFLRYYFLPAVQKVNVFADAGFGFGSTKPGDGASSVSSNAFTIMAGPAIFLNQHTALEIAPYYTSIGGDGGGSRTSQFGLNIGFQIHLGAALAKK